jgi:hypothetical protein
MYENNLTLLDGILLSFLKKFSIFISERMKIALQELEERKGEKFTSMEALKQDLLS